MRNIIHSFRVVDQALCFCTRHNLQKETLRYYRASGRLSAFSIVDRAISEMAYDEEGSDNTNFSNIISNREDAIAKNLVDETVYKALKNQINSAELNLKNYQMKTCSDSFPFKDESISDYCRKLALERKFVDGEVVVLEIDTDVININPKDDDKDSKAPLIPMYVNVYMPGTKHELTFQITLSTKDIIIQRCIAVNKEEKVEKACYEIEELNPHVQSLLYKYLEVRGISSNITSDLIKIIAKHKKEVDLRGLKILDNFIKPANTC